MKSKLYLILTSLIVFSLLQSQTLHLEECQQLAEKNFPLIQQYDLIHQSKEFNIENANKAYLPQINILGQASYQSDVTKVPIDVPNFPIQELSKFQYRMYGEVVQPLSDLYIIKNQKELIKAQEDIQSKKIDVDIYQLKDRINNLYFGVLLIDAQIEQLKLMQTDIKTGLNKVDVAIQNGVALKSNKDVLMVQLVQSEQKIDELNTNRKAFIQMLSLFTHQNIGYETIFNHPEMPMLNTDIHRPELDLIDLQKKLITLQNKMTAHTIIPHVSAFFQGGFGRPALNMLDNSTKPYYIGGVRIAWNVSNFYTFNNNKKINLLQEKNANIQQDIFMFNTNMELANNNTEIEKYQLLLEKDDEIISLRQNITNTAMNQLANGVITANDFISYTTAEQQAKQNKSLHQIQLLMAMYAHQNSIGTNY